MIDVLELLSQEAQTSLAIEKFKRESPPDNAWPEIYRHATSGKVYTPHNQDEERFVELDTPRYALLKGGEGAGKSVAGIIKTLERIKRGMSGIMVSPDFTHFQKSLWPEFKQWCPWSQVIPRHQYRNEPGWEPMKAFMLTFKNAFDGFTDLICGGCKESDLGSWHGPNKSFVFMDEIRRHNTPTALKTFDGRCRVPGYHNEPSQIFLTTTPKKHWLYDYFGPLKDNDPHRDFKKNSFVGTISAEENKDNLEESFLTFRQSTLTASEARIFIQAEWEEESNLEKFVNIFWWKQCYEDLPPLSPNEALIISLDASTGSTIEGYTADYFAVAGLTRHPRNPEIVAIRYYNEWQPESGQLLDFEPIEHELIRLCQTYSVLEVTYDKYQLHDMAMRMTKKELAFFRPFGQHDDRLVADKDLQERIKKRLIVHNGDSRLETCIDNADFKKSTHSGGRITKRTSSLKIDGAIAVSQGANRCLYYNV